MENENVIWHERPELVKPYLIMGFSGWANAGEVPASVLWYLISRFEAVLFAELKTDVFYNYQATGAENRRPIVNVEDGMVQSFSFNTTNLWYRKNYGGERDIILVSGPEPEQGWNQYADFILDLAQAYQVEKIFTIGGTFDAIPHTVPPRVTAVVSQTELKGEVKSHGIELIYYKGPSSIHTLFMVNAARRNIPMISLWAHTPHYIQVTNFIACYNIMVKLSGLMNLEIDLAIARRDSEYLTAQIDQAVEKKPELQDYLRMLESEYHKGNPNTQNPINKNIIKEIEELFKDKQG
jgi:proteasome assembly chaperone (PAC2) family protein